MKKSIDFHLDNLGNFVIFVAALFDWWDIARLLLDEHLRNN
jgi:hypothetical protein